MGVGPGLCALPRIETRCKRRRRPGRGDTQHSPAEPTLEPPSGCSREVAVRVSEVLRDALDADFPVARRLLVRLPVLWERIGAQPQGDVRRLHRLPYYTHQFIIQCLKVSLVTQRR